MPAAETASGYRWSRNLPNRRLDPGRQFGRHFREPMHRGRMCRDLGHDVGLVLRGYGELAALHYIATAKMLRHRDTPSLKSDQPHDISPALINAATRRPDPHRAGTPGRSLPLHTRAPYASGDAHRRRGTVQD